MKPLLVTFLGLICIGCLKNSSEEGKEGSKNGIFETSFKNYQELDILNDYKKISDTSIDTGGWQHDYRLMHLKKKRDELVLFYKVVNRDSVFIHDYSYQVLDTLHIKDLKEDERLSIGYCYHDSLYDGEAMALVKRTDSLRINNILKAWRANPSSQKIEVLEDHQEVNCLNQFLESENATIPIEKIS